MRLILVRHGQTPCNIGNRFHGWEDCELTETGLAQARAVARRLTGERVDAVYSSDLRRAMQTARAIADPHGLQPLAEPGLRERSAGRFEGMDADGVTALAPTWQRDRSADYWGWAPPDGETLRQVLGRTLAVVERLQAEHGEGTVVAVTHMGPVRVLLSHLTGVSLEETYRVDFPSTGVTIFSFAAGEVRAEALNDASHVDM